MEHDHNSEPYMEFDFESMYLPKKRTGLPYKIWIDGLGRETKNVPIVRVDIDRGRVCLNDNYILDDHLIPITISDDPVILGDGKLLYFEIVKKWIIKNKEFLLEQVLIAEKGNFISTLSFLEKETTKLPYDIRVDSFGSVRKVFNNRDFPIVRVQMHDRVFIDENFDIDKEFIAVTISDEPYIVHGYEIPQFDLIRAWIIKHKDALLKHWKGEFSDSDLIDATKADKKQS